MYTLAREKQCLSLIIYTIYAITPQIIPLPTLTLVRTWYEESTPWDIDPSTYLLLTYMLIYVQWVLRAQTKLIN